MIAFGLTLFTFSNKHMNLNEALFFMLQGRKIKLPEWGGYWTQSIMSDTKGPIAVVLKTGETIYTPDFTQYGGREDWEVVEE